MINKAVEQSRFAEFIDGLLLEVIHRGLTSFDQILLSLPGVYPSTALASLQRLASKGKIPEKMFLDAVKLTSDRQCKQMTPESSGGGTTGRVVLPVPHPLDFDWRFGDKATDHLLERCLELTDVEDCAVLLGTPSVLARAIEHDFPRKMVLFEGNPAVTDSLTRFAPKGSVFNCDLTGDELPQISAKAVICDSPWYMEYVKSFLWSACQLCATDGYLLLSTPPAGTRPNVSEEWAMILEWADRLGFRLLSVEYGVLPYVSPPFERNALKVEGLHNIPGEWRCSNLALFVLKHRARVPRPPECLRDRSWREEVFQDVRIRFREGSDVTGLEDPTLNTIVPGDILPSVSRWDDRRRLVDVWTSGNRIFRCDNPGLLCQIAKSIVCNQSPKEIITGCLGRTLTLAETELVAKASEQIINIINIEKNEYVSYWEEVS